MLALPFITPNELAPRLGRPDAPRIIDVRIDEDRRAHPVFLPGAVRCPHAEVADLEPSGRESIVVCHKGLKLSQGAAAILRARGDAARVLDGGMVGWLAHGLPTMAFDPADTRPWVMGETPDREALLSTWLLARFLCADAVTLRAAADQIDAVAERFNGRRLPQPTALLADAALDLSGRDALFEAVAALPARLFTGMAALAESEEDHLARVFPVFDALYSESRP